MKVVSNNIVLPLLLTSNMVLVALIFEVVLLVVLIEGLCNFSAFMDKG
jgi:hypothetical protein